MAKMTMPMARDQAGLRPPLPSQIPVNDELRQTLALLFALANSERTTLKCSPSGILYTTSPRLVDVFHWLAAAPNAVKQGDDIVCTEVLCMAHPDNTGRIWVRTKTAAASNNAFPLDKGDPIGFAVENLSELQALIVTNGDTLIVGYSL